MTRITTLSDPEAVAERAARDIAEHLHGAVARRGAAHLALSGGSTPRRTYELLAAALREWRRVEVWFADERCVPPDHDDSNYRMASETLLAHIQAPGERVHRMRGELGPEQGAGLYAQELRAGVPGQEGLPVLDVVVLGIGPDGHVASLFPGAPALQAGPETICLPVHDSPKPPPERITLSLALLRAARRCVLIATGAAKADAVSAALGEPSSHVPASLLARRRLSVIVDDPAAPAVPLR